MIDCYALFAIFEAIFRFSICDFYVLSGDLHYYHFQLSYCNRFYGVI